MKTFRRLDTFLSTFKNTRAQYQEGFYAKFRSYSWLICISVGFSQACITTRDFSDGLSKEILKQGYIYQRASRTEQLSIKFLADSTFNCDRASYVPKYEGMDWGGGSYEATKDGIVLTNKDCKLDPEFKSLKCILERKYGIGVQYIWRCQNEKAEEYSFWMIDK